MGRMFRIITEGSLDHPNGGPAAVAVPDLEPFVKAGAPFIEVGGPNGPVHSLAQAEPPAATRGPVAEPYLSVALHHAAESPAGALPNAIAPDVVAFHLPDHHVSAEYRELRDGIRRQLGGDGPKVVAFLAAAPGSGTTTVAANLAVTLAAEPATRVLLIDADLARPTAARKLGLADTPGLAEVLNQSTPLAWALQPTAVPRLQLLAAGCPDAATATAMELDFSRLVDQLRQWFDWVLIDGGPWDEGQQPTADAVYLVARTATLNEPGCMAARDQVLRHGALVRGYISTKA